MNYLLFNPLADGVTAKPLVRELLKNLLPSILTYPSIQSWKSKVQNLLLN